jgi:hypothetical protein
MGGSVSAGKSYLVGEGGPEIYTPSASGQIVPGGGVTVHQSIHFDVGLESVDSRIAEAVPSISKAAQAGVMRAVHRPSIA